MADEVNIYSYREPELIAPLTEAFTQETGIEVNVAYLSKGMVERLKAEGRRSPADVILTVDISRLAEIVGQELTQPVAFGHDGGTRARSLPRSQWALVRRHHPCARDLCEQRARGPV
jgi:ABC-type thiamine transport system substrate-binding protein